VEIINAFSRLGKTVSIFDTDKIDIHRTKMVTNEDGSQEEILDKSPTLVGIKCHLSYEKQDNPDMNTIGTKPIIKSLKIDCPYDTDIRNNDRVTAYKLGAGGVTLATYKGVANEPTSYVSRKTATMAIAEMM